MIHCPLALAVAAADKPVTPEVAGSSPVAPAPKPTDLLPKRVRITDEPVVELAEKAEAGYDLDCARRKVLQSRSCAVLVRKGSGLAITQLRGVGVGLQDLTPSRSIYHSPRHVTRGGYPRLNAETMLDVPASPAWPRSVGILSTCSVVFSSA